MHEEMFVPLRIMLWRDFGVEQSCKLRLIEQWPMQRLMEHFEVS